MYALSSALLMQPPLLTSCEYQGYWRRDWRRVENSIKHIKNSLGMAYSQINLWSAHADRYQPLPSIRSLNYW